MTFYLLIGILFFLQVADLVLTHRALELGAREANPLAHWLLAQTGSVWIAGIVAKGPIFVLVALSESSPLAVIAIALMGWVCWNNAQVIKRLS
jgi:hypothetical protein